MLLLENLYYALITNEKEWERERWAHDLRFEMLQQVPKYKGKTKFTSATGLPNLSSIL